MEFTAIFSTSHPREYKHDAARAGAVGMDGQRKGMVWYGLVRAGWVVGHGLHLWFYGLVVCVGAARMDAC